MNKIYWQKQSGGLCRMHSLNGYFEKDKISQSEFNNYCVKYDKYIEERYNQNISSKSFDIVNSDHLNVVSYILKENEIYSIYIPFNYLKKELDNRKLLNISDFFNKTNYIFVFNEGHIWGIRKYENQYYKVDSLNGITKININSFNNVKNIGFIIPINNKEYIKNELKHLIELVKLFLIKENIGNINLNNLQNLMIKLHKEKRILDVLEIYINLIVDITEILNIKSDIIKKYNEFIKVFTNKNYLNIKLINKYVPNIILDIIKENF
jgi:hypothetical protein